MNIWLVSTLAILHSIAMNICTQRLVSVPSFSPFGYVATHGVSATYGLSMFNFLENGGEISVPLGLVKCRKAMLLKTACNAVEAIPYEYSETFFTEAKRVFAV